jgi:hypothetical protein
MWNWTKRNMYVLLAFAGCAESGGNTAPIPACKDGTLIKTEVTLAVGSLPTAVTAAVAGKGTIREAEVIVRADGVSFEVEIGDTEYWIDVNGKILARETEESGDDKD